MPDASRATRGLACAALAGVSLIAAVVSYLHALAVVRSVGARPPVAYLIPFLADLVILGASAALLDAARCRARLSLLAVLSLVAGVGVTLAMNVAAGLGHGTAGALVAGWPAVAFILALESLAGMVRRGRAGLPAPAGTAARDACPHGVAGSAEEAVRLAFEHGRDCLGEPVSYRQLAARFGVDRNKVPRLVAPTDAAVAVPPPPGASGGPPRPPATAAANGSHGA